MSSASSPRVGSAKSSTRCHGAAWSPGRATPTTCASPTQYSPTRVAASWSTPPRPSSRDPPALLPTPLRRRGPHDGRRDESGHQGPRRAARHPRPDRGPSRTSTASSEPIRHHQLNRRPRIGPGVDENVAASWNAEYANGRYRGEPPVADELRDVIGTSFTEVVPLRSHSTPRIPPGHGQWSQWEAIWQQRPQSR